MPSVKNPYHTTIERIPSIEVAIHYQNVYSDRSGHILPDLHQHCLKAIRPNPSA